MTRPKPFDLCRTAARDGQVYYTVVSSHATRAAAVSAGLLRAGTFAPGVYLVRDSRLAGTAGEWVCEVGGETVRTA